MNSVNNIEDKKITIKKFIWLIVAVTSVWAISGYLLYPLKQDRGTIGDMFGAVNALFSGLAFATLIYTMYLQRDELELQRRELKDTRNELKEQKEYLAAQNDVLRTQNFENTFFQLLKQLNEIRELLKLSDYGVLHHGKSAFELVFGELINFRKKLIDEEKVNNLTKDEVVRHTCNYVFKKRQDDLGHYFRTLYNLIKFVKQSNVTDKKFYTNLIRAQLSTHEVLIIFYDCLSDLGSEKFKPLIEEFALLKIVTEEILIDPYDYSLFAKSAYK